VRWMTERPAELIGVSNFKGKIEEGFDADFAIFNPNKKMNVSADHIQFKNKLSAYEGQVRLP
jgi:allantoinase